MYNINDEIMIFNDGKLIKVIIIEINLDGTFVVKTEHGETLRIYREDIKE
jgi:hypothetical protein